MASILVLNGPNLNLLGNREPEHYGHTSLDSINKRLVDIAQVDGHTLTAYQSNAEHELVERVQKAQTESVNFIVINPAAFTHTSIALRDALAATQIPFIEIHLSNIFSREAFRKESYFSDIAIGVISGLGAIGYELALTAALNHISTSKTSKKKA